MINKNVTKILASSLLRTTQMTIPQKKKKKVKCRDNQRIETQNKP